MIYKRSLTASAVLACICFLETPGLAGEALRLGQYFWPTPNRAFLERESPSRFLQPTSSGRSSSALFGCVRSGGAQFHEGVDLKATQRDAAGEATDPVYAFDRGVVRHVNRAPSESSYGRYIVVEHSHIAPGLVTLYAHLGSVLRGMEAGVEVRGGQQLAVLGRSANHTIPQSRAHLHFEIGQWLGDDFQLWYDQQGYSSANQHGSYNGLNIVGIDVWDCLLSLRDGAVSTVEEYLAIEPVAAVVRVRDSSIPSILRLQPELLANPTRSSDLAGWKIEFTWYGLPVRWTGLTLEELVGTQSIEAEAVPGVASSEGGCVSLATAGSSAPTGRLVDIVGRLFVRQ